VIYELHVGTFTPEGTWLSALEKLPHILELGIKVIEVMPISDFAGSRNWGYDGVCLYSPSRSYGRPEDFRLFVGKSLLTPLLLHFFFAGCTVYLIPLS
jgi:maltooligosyltrehalose trehalohydrolase